MTDSSKTTLSPVEDGPQYHDMYNNTWLSSSSTDVADKFRQAYTLIFMVSPFICIIGLPGNGIVIYHLAFHVKRSPFTTYILNLAVADFGVLLFFGLNFISKLTGAEILIFIDFVVATFMQSTSQLLLTAISIDRCASVLFPIWHRCHQPPHLSTMVCALMWVLACLPSGSLAILHHFKRLKDGAFFYLFIAGPVLCLPLVTVSTMILLSKVFCKSQQPRRRRLLTIVLLVLLSFLIFVFPLNAILTVNYFTSSQYDYLILYGYLCYSLNSCVNPVIYYTVGRKKRGRQRQSLKVIFQRAFEEEGEHREERDTTAQTSL